MRDLLVIIVVFGALPWIFTRPYIGVLFWSWLGYMNPHRLTWSFAYDFPFAQVVALATLVGLLFSRERKRIPWTPTTAIWVMFVLWMNVTTLFALDPAFAYAEWDRTMKIQLMTLVTLMVMAAR